MSLRKLGWLTICVMLVFSLVGCGNKVDSQEVSKYADNITEKMLLAYNEDNYQQYIADVDSEFKAVVTEEKMQEGNAMVRGKIGTYVPGSKKFRDAVRTSEKGKKFVVVRYNAQFTDENGDVLVTMIFNDNEAHQVAGIFFNSPQLR